MAFSSGVMRYFYPRPPRGRRRCGAACFHLPDMISIHALREEGDRVRVAGEFPRQEFLSTPSARRATSPSLFPILTAKHFYPRPPRGGRRERRCRKSARSYFYPRPPRGGRPTTSTLSQFFARFLSTPSARRATLPDSIASKHFSISIHALREEGDYPPWQVRPPARYFYPRPPRGGRRGKDSRWQPQEKFLSTPSARRATPLSCVSQSLAVISIHALREEGDL